jgi:glycosyltransferase involved in cell wall biosynthesis
MRIGIDVRCLSDGRKTGVEEYTLNLLHNLFEKDTKNEYILFFNSFKDPKINFDWTEKYPNVKIKKFRLPNKLLNLSFWYLGWPKIDKLIGGADVIFFPNIIFGSVSKKAKMVVTIHDLSFERYPETFSLKKRLWHIFINPKKLCRSADKIIAVSGSTKNDLVSIYHINPGKIIVIYSGISEKFKIISRNEARMIEVKEKYGLPYKFILYLGTIEPRKNIGAIVRAYESLKKYAKNNNLDNLEKYKLIIAGHSGWMEKKIFSEISEIRKRLKNPEDIGIINFVKDEDKEYVLNLASLFVYPSFFEGFGFPPLEAMKCGVPVIVSNNSSFPETVGDAGIMVDPDRPEEIYTAMKEFFQSKEIQDKLREKGLKKAAGFSWEKTAEEFLNLINGINKK